MEDIVTTLIKYGPLGIIISVLLITDKINIFNYFLSSEVERQLYTKTQRLYYNIFNLASTIFLFSFLVYMCSFNSITGKRTAFFYDALSLVFSVIYLLVAVSYLFHNLKAGKIKAMSDKSKSFLSFIEKNIYILYMAFILLFLLILIRSDNTSNFNNTYFDYETSRLLYSFITGVTFYIIAVPFRYFILERKPAYYIVLEGKEWKIEYAINKNDLLLSNETNKFKILKYSDIIGKEINKK